eukprot:SAG31_NODE_6275_length_2093_cov_1.289368_2_plen_284_part_00
MATGDASGASILGSLCSEASGCSTQQLLDTGYIQIDNFLGARHAHELRAELVSAAAKGMLQPQQFEFGGRRFVKPQVFELDFHRSTATGRTGDCTPATVLPGFSKLFNEHCPKLIAALNRLHPSLQLRPRVDGPGDSVTLKLQHNRGGGGCFPWHYDNPGPPNNRKITCLVYLNPDWRPGHGGELQLLPFLSEAGATTLETNCTNANSGSDGAVTIPPLMDRAVLFLSDRMLHRVLPAVAERFCFTIWIDANGTNSDADVFLRPVSPLLICRTLCHQICSASL